GRSSASQARISVTLTDQQGQLINGTPLNTSADSSGRFTLGNIPTGVYNVRVKSPTSLSSVAAGLSFISGGTVQHDFGTLAAGDANHDDAVTITDFAALRADFGEITACRTANPPSVPC